MDYPIEVIRTFQDGCQLVKTYEVRAVDGFQAGFHRTDFVGYAPTRCHAEELAAGKGPDGFPGVILEGLGLLRQSSEFFPVKWPHPVPLCRSKEDVLHRDDVHTLSPEEQLLSTGRAASDASYSLGQPHVIKRYADGYSVIEIFEVRSRPGIEDDQEHTSFVAYAPNFESAQDIAAAEGPHGLPGMIIKGVGLLTPAGDIWPLKWRVPVEFTVAQNSSCSPFGRDRV